MHISTRLQGWWALCCYDLWAVHKEFQDSCAAIRGTFERCRHISSPALEAFGTNQGTLNIVAALKTVYGIVVDVSIIVIGRVERSKCWWLSQRRQFWWQSIFPTHTAKSTKGSYHGKNQWESRESRGEMYGLAIVSLGISDRCLWALSRSKCFPVVR